MTPVSTGALVLITMGKLPASVYQHMLVTSVRLVSSRHWLISADDRHSLITLPTVLCDVFRLGAMRARLG